MKEWISVKDRLPENGQIVLIQHKETSYLPVVAKYKPSHHKQFLIPYTGDWGIENITHWMPLPEPPKE